MSLLNKFRKNIKKTDLKEEIFEHICDLLNTKKTFGAIEKELGLDNYVYIGSNKEMNKKIISDIKFCLEKYESRIQVIDILSIPSQNHFSLSFLIKCKINNQSHSFQISFYQQKNNQGLNYEPSIS
jgi:predicted component of type VI protein secretion system